MEVKRLYNREYGFIVFVSIVFISIAAIVVILTATLKGDSFKEHLIKGNYDSLYNYIENPDFSKEIFYAYMDYNYGDDKKIISVKRFDNEIEYTVKGTQEEKVIRLYKNKRRYVWKFDDYVYAWEIKVPIDAEVMIEDTPFYNDHGIVMIKKIPFSVYDITINAKNCETLKSKMLVGQNIAVSLKPSDYVIKRCIKSISEYLSLKEFPLKLDLEEVKCIDRDSGLYREVIDEVEWFKANGVVSKKMINMEIRDGFMDAYGVLYITVKESWNIEVASEGRIEIKNDNNMNMYTIAPLNNFIIETVKTVNDKN